MAGKSSDGFTKSAQKKKFVRHRDVKMKEKELKKEANIKRVMCEGVCKRCRDKVQWRFKYDKYKPLKNPGTCQQCKNKTVTKAYRTLCDKCATSRQSCASCCRNILEANAADLAESEKLTEVAGTEGSRMEVSSDKEDAEHLSGRNESDSEDDQDNDEELDEEDEEDDEADAIKKPSVVFSDNITLSGQEKTLSEGDKTVGIAFETIWDEKKFFNIAASKYSKNRPVVAMSLAENETAYESN
eukprot:gene26323-34951_t